MEEVTDGDRHDETMDRSLAEAGGSQGQREPAELRIGNPSLQVPITPQTAAQDTLVAQHVGNYLIVDSGRNRLLDKTVATGGFLI